MVDRSNVPSRSLWQSILREARSSAAADPVFGRALSAAVLDHPDLGHMIAHQIGVRLGRRDAEGTRLARIARDAQHAAPVLVEAAADDLRAIAARDPASSSLLPPLLNYKGYVALQAYRVSHWLWTNDRPDLALLLQAESSASLQVSIHPSALLGTAVFLDHATGIVIGAYADVGDDVTILQNVTVGRQDALPGRAPRIGRGALISSGATILGDVTVGDFAKIGADALVTRDVPAGCTAVGTPARLTNCPQAPAPAGA
ncbi:serine acetyltransferase [Bradyrhizobium sp. SRS-191]|uniref:serine O-acetyltransferase n=1 Tax=Bradyrhizobium sp. SRS-191 TaxID=2962606 RepID=UPI00211F39CE|nr:serine acetyltransferase [Bradyrhizobium sp. SRS-191]